MEEETPEEDKETGDKKASALAGDPTLGLTSIGAVLSAPTPETSNNGKEKREKAPPTGGSERRLEDRHRDGPQSVRGGSRATSSGGPRPPVEPPARRDQRRDRSRSRKRKNKGKAKRERGREWRAAHYPRGDHQWRRKQR